MKNHSIINKRKAPIEISIAHLYPREMNIYGDRGNIIALRKRLEWRGYRVKLDEVEPTTSYDFTKADIIFGGGGQDRGQVLVAEDLQQRKNNLHEAIEDGVVALTICGTYQLFGHGFTTIDLDELPGISIFKARTVGSDQRMIGNIVVQSQWGELVGFENHSGQTELELTQEPLGVVKKGFGNNSFSRNEGAVYKNAFGSYLHGPLLPKNPHLTDELLRRVLERRGITELSPLEDSLEIKAAAIAKNRS